MFSKVLRFFICSHSCCFASWALGSIFTLKGSNKLGYTGRDAPAPAVTKETRAPAASPTQHSLGSSHCSFGTTVSFLPISSALLVGWLSHCHIFYSGTSSRRPACSRGVSNTEKVFPYWSVEGSLYIVPGVGSEPRIGSWVWLPESDRKINNTIYLGNRSNNWCFVSSVCLLSFIYQLSAGLSNTTYMHLYTQNFQVGCFLRLFIFHHF